MGAGAQLIDPLIAAAIGVSADPDGEASALQHRTALRRKVRNTILPLSTALIDFGRGDYDAAALGLLRSRPQLDSLGGAAAQRDVLCQTLIVSCLRAGWHECARGLLSERAATRPGSPLVWRWQAEALSGMGHEAMAERAYYHAQTLGFGQGGWGAH